MRHRSKLPLAVVLLVLIVLPTQTQAKDFVIKKPPASLDQLYPPKSLESKWIQQMHAISGNFGGVFVDMREKDWENAEKQAAQLIESYKKTAEMISEWKDYFDHDAVKAFAEAVKTRDPEKIGKAAGPVGKTCNKCHEEQIVGVWTRYHWPSVEHMKITDPVDEKEMEYGKYMGAINGAFKGVTVNFGEGQYDRALKSADVFKKRLMELKSTCSKCHVTDNVKQFFVGDEVAKAMDAMRAELAAPKPDPAKFWKSVGDIGKQSCKMCHLTHRSYAIIQEVWDEEEAAVKK